MEITGNALQTVGVNQNVLFSETPVCGSCSIMHREGSGLVNLRGLTQSQPRARFLVNFGANIAIPADGTVGPISLAIAINGEPVQSTLMIITPTATSAFFNVASSAYIDVPAGCCSQISIENTSTQAISVENANLIVTREA